MELIADIVGVIGVLCGIGAYFLLQRGVISASSAAYLGLNLLSPSLIMLSLLVHWNLPAFMLQLAWLAITLYGIHKHLWRQS